MEGKGRTTPVFPNIPIESIDGVDGLRNTVENGKGNAAVGHEGEEVLDSVVDARIRVPTVSCESRRSLRIVVPAEVLRHPDELRQQQRHHVNRHEGAGRERGEGVVKVHEAPHRDVHNDVDEVEDGLRVGGELVPEEKVGEAHDVEGDEEDGETVPQHVPLVLGVLRLSGHGGRHASREGQDVQQEEEEGEGPDERGVVECHRLLRVSGRSGLCLVKGDVVPEVHDHEHHQRVV